jgi:hypothetical protein
MEEEALAMIEAELRARGVARADIEAHAERRRRETLPLPDGTAVKCSFCPRPAVRGEWGWHRLWGELPVFPRYYYTCAEHHGKVWALRTGRAGQRVQRASPDGSAKPQAAEGQKD